MKNLGELLNTMNTLSITGAKPGRKMTGICCDSRQVKRNMAFVAIKGAKADGHSHIQEAIKKGATTIVAERTPDARIPKDVTVVLVNDSRAALARMADYFYDSPSEDVRVIGVTGTNGKTTTTYLIEAMLAEGGEKCGKIGTIGYSLLGETFPAENTTPESLDLQRMLASLRDKGAGYCALEVSSHALTQSRVDWIRFRSAVFTNLTQDHLDYHGDMDSYFAAKARLFTEHSPDKAIINIDDPCAPRLLGMIETGVLTYGIDGPANVTAEDISISVSGIRMKLKTPIGGVDIHSSLTGTHNVYNILAAAAVAIGENVRLDEIAAGLEKLTRVPGRFETVDAGQPFSVVVDYAHTDDALRNVLRTARSLTKARIITVFGCGGDRDRKKRPLMGRAAWTMSDKVVVTSDNPRTEDPRAIIREIVEGIHEIDNPRGEMKIVPDRSEAIKIAINWAETGDIVLIAGKGHETYQIIGTSKKHFDDSEEAVTAIRDRYGKI